MKEKTKFWMQMVPILAVGLVVPAWFGANWLSLSVSTTVVFWATWVQVSKHGYGYVNKHIWRRPNWKWPRLERHLDG